LNKRTSINSIPRIHKEKEMADFRKWLYAFAVVALLAGLTVPASAQSTLMTCSGTANNPLVRAEDYTALTGDIFIQCQGGIPTAQGSLVPKVNITVFVNAPVTSKLTSNSGENPAFNEALLIMDEAGSVGSSNPILNCGNSAAPYGNIPFTCDIVSTGDPTQTYDGTQSVDGSNARPNVFQARVVNNSNGTAIQFIGVPVDPPGPPTVLGATPPIRSMRITNLRVNAVSFGITAGGPFNLTATVQSVVTFNGTNFGGSQVINVVNGTVRVGLTVGSAPANATATFLQCNATDGTIGTAITLTEGFPTAFKVRNWEQIQDNGTPPAMGGGDWSYNSPSTVWTATDLNQNVPNALYNTESGLMFPPGLANPSVPDAMTGNPPPGTGPSGTWAGGIPFNSPQHIDLAGTASQGTRFAIHFSNIPVGSNPTIPRYVYLFSGVVKTGVMVAVTGADAHGAGGTPVSSGPDIPVDSNSLAIYEVLFSAPSAIETATIVVSVHPDVDLGANPPAGGTPQVGVTATAVAGFAPFYSPTTSGVGMAQYMNATLGANGAPIPRFIDTTQPSTPINLYSYSKCACDLLFPWVVGDSTFTTSIVVANTSLDPCAGSGSLGCGFSARPQDGHVTFWFFGTSDVSFNPASFGSATGPATVTGSQTSSVIVPAGSYLAFVVSPLSSVAGSQTASNGLKPIDGNFAGYVIAQSEFQYCHGVASLTSTNAGFGTQTYLGLVLDKATFLEPKGGVGLGNNSSYGWGGIQLRRTNQDFADDLDN
jgi:hypothetical protein